VGEIILATSWKKLKKKKIAMSFCLSPRKELPIANEMCLLKMGGSPLGLLCNEMVR